MTRIWKILMVLLIPIYSTAQTIFEQNFKGGNRYTSYVGADVNKFDVISNFGNAPVSIENGFIKWNKKASSSVFFTKSSNLNTTEVLKAEFTLAIKQPEELNNYSGFSASFLIGSGEEAAWTEKSSTATPLSVHTKMVIKPQITATGASFTISNSPKFFGKQNIIVYANNTGSAVKYKLTDGREYVLADQAFDVFVGDKKVINGAKALKAGTALNMFKFIYPSNAPNAIIEIGDFKFTDLAGSNTITKIEGPKQIIDKDPNILLAWQFTYPQETSGKEVAYLATTNHQALETAQLSRGFNAAPGAGSKRGFTGLFPIEHSRKQAEESGSYYEVNIKPKRNQTVSLQSIEAIVRRQKDSPYIYRWAYSLDGKIFKDIGDKDILVDDLNSLGIKQPIINLGNYPDLQNVKHVQKILLRMYVWGAKANTGHERSFGFGKSSDEGSNVLIIKGEVN